MIESPNYLLCLTSQPDRSSKRVSRGCVALERWIAHDTEIRDPHLLICRSVPGGLRIHLRPDYDRF
jgi:hypothetical protein